MAHVLVTGGAGYVATHALFSLLEAGHKIIIVDNLCRGNLHLIPTHPDIVFIQGDILDPNLLFDTLQSYSIDAVMHYAALAYVEESYRKPDDYYRVNALGTFNLLQAMVRYRPASPPPLVFSSSCAVYGDVSGSIIKETMDLLPISPYGKSKLCAEWMIKDFFNAYNLHYVILRYFNAAGADTNNRIGECHHPETHLIPLAIQAARTHQQFSVNGLDHPTKDGSALRDFVHVLDLASAHLLSLNYLLNGGKPSCFNLGSGAGFTVLEVLKLIELKFGKNIMLNIKSRRPGDPSSLVCDSSRALHSLGWSPVHSSLEQIISDAIAWDRYCYGVG